MLNNHTITFIEAPKFAVDFQKYEPVLKSTDEKIVEVILEPLKAVAVLFESFVTALYRTLSLSGTSFKITVLGSINPHIGTIPRSFPIAIFRLGVWGLGLVLGVAATTSRLFYAKMWGQQTDESIHKYNAELNMAHMKCSSETLDASHVPQNVTVDSLRDILNEIDFTDPTSPLYMPPNSRKDPDKSEPSSREELLGALNTFISNVNGRIPFLGTPPGYQPTLLLAFYQQIEDSIRISIDKSNEDIRKFKEEKGDDFAEYDETTRNKYKNLLEDRAGIALNSAIAGFHCGARYMGESMRTYYSIKGSNMEPDATLEGTLQDLLSQERLTIANRQIQNQLGSDTHKYTKYMSQFGTMLGIPGSQNIVESLAWDLNTVECLERFFQEYNADAIIDVVQKEVKSSQIFREKIMAWVGDQIGDWKPANFEVDVANTISRVSAILMSNDIDVTEELDKINDLHILFSYLNFNGVALPDRNQEDFWGELLALDEAKAWLSQHFAADLQGKNTIQQRMHVSTLKSQIQQLGKSLTKEQVEQLIGDAVNGQGLPIDKWEEPLVIKRKIAKITQILPHMSIGTVERIVTGQLDRTIAIRDAMALQARTSFLENLKIFTFAQPQTDDPDEILAITGLTPEMMEWLLVSHNIFTPQLTKRLEFQMPQIVAGTPLSDDEQIFAEALKKNFQLRNLMFDAMMRRIEIMDFSTPQWIVVVNGLLRINEIKDKGDVSIKRFHFDKDNVNGEAQLQTLYRKLFQLIYVPEQREQLTSLAEKASADGQPFYPTLTKTWRVTLPKAGCEFLKDPIIKIIAEIAGFIFTAVMLYKGYNALENYNVTVITPYVRGNIPPHILEEIDSAWKIAKEYYLSCYLYLMLIDMFMPIFDEIPIVSPALRIFNVRAILDMFSPQDIFGIVWRLGWDSGQSLGNALNSVGNYMEPREAEAEVFDIEKQRSFEVFVTVMEKLRLQQQSVVL